MLTVSQNDLAACGLSPAAAGRRTAGLAFTKRRGAKGAPVQQYALASVLPRLTAAQAIALLPLAQDDGDLWVGGDDMLPVAREVEAWVTKNVPGGPERLHACRVTFFAALKRAVRSSSFTGDVERLRVLLSLSEAVFPFILTGDRDRLPADWPEYARIFALLHGAPPFQHELIYTEAA